MTEEYIRDVGGRFLGIIETQPNGDKTARMWQSRLIVGYYRKKSNTTTDFYGRIFSYGDTLAVLIYKNL